MNIILVSGSLAKARTITLGAPQLLLLGTSVLAVVVALAFVLHYATARYAPDTLPAFFTASADRREADEFHLSEHINAIAVRLGHMQAQLLRLDTLGERLARLAGFKPQELLFGETPGQGGAAPDGPAQSLSIDDVTRQLDERGDRLGLLESLFTLNRAKEKLVPTRLPVDGGWYSSNYGWRIDPFTGQRAFHDGIDFMAEQGTPIHAAAAGVVSYSDFHPQYGNMIEIDHGSGLMTRYAHASMRAVKVGDIVMRGARIGEVGRTGRATGTHLHFEVRRNGAPQNPTRFLHLPG